MAWRQGTIISHRRRSMPDGPWSSISDIVTNPRGLGNPALSGDPSGQLHLAWSGWTTFSERAIYTSRCLPVVRPRVFLPNVQA